MGNTKEALATEHTLQGDEIVCGPGTFQRGPLNYPKYS